jgi:hypothetical protein
MRWFTCLVFLVALSLSALEVFARSSQLPPGITRAELEEEVEVSYLYAGVLGSGTYKIGNRRVSMFRLPFKWKQRKPTETTHGWTWLFPAVIGYDDLGNVDSDWIGALLPDQLVTLSVLPGVEYTYPVSERWQLKPFAQVGAGRDFSADQTFLMTVLGVRSLARFDVRDAWTLRWAHEEQLKSEDDSGFTVFDTGLDVRRDTPWRVFGTPMDSGAYYNYQRYIPRWTSSQAPDERVRSVNLHEFGLSLGFKRPYKILGFNVPRVRLGYKKGDNVRGWSVGTEFPF